jgi:hypothetical protein
MREQAAAGHRSTARAVAAAGATGLVVLTALAGCGSDPGEHEYSAGFTLTFPEGWQRREDYRDMPLVAIAPAEDGQAFPVNLNVRIVGNSEGLEIEEFYERHFDEELGRSVQKDFKLIDVSDRRLSEYPAKRVVYTHRVEPDDLKSLAWVILAGRRGYIVTGNAAVDQFAEFEKVFDEIAATFEAE